jgi:predicted dehydrogenase
MCASGNTVRWGLIGCGDIARKRVAPALRDGQGCELAAVCRARSELAESFAREFGARRWHADWRDLVRDPDIDAVYVATPVDLHAPQSIAAAEAGRHVLCEKPMALSTAQCRAMIDACRANGVRLGVAYYRHFYPVVHRIKEIIAAGEIGRVGLADIQALEWYTIPEDSPRAWFFRRDRNGGGVLMDFGCHRIEVLLNLLGPVDEVRGLTGNTLFRREVEDTATAGFRFQSGAMAHLAVAVSVKEPRDSLDVFGSEGSIHVPVLNQGAVRVVRSGTERLEDHPPHPNLHQPLAEDFARAVLDGREPEVGGETGLEVQRLIESVYGTHGGGRPPRITGTSAL